MNSQSAERHPSYIYSRATASAWNPAYRTPVTVAQPLRSLLALRMRLLDGVIIPCVPIFRIDSCEGCVLNQNSGNSGENDSRPGDLSVEAEFAGTSGHKADRRLRH